MLQQLSQIYHLDIKAQVLPSILVQSNWHENNLIIFVKKKKKSMQNQNSQCFYKISINRINILNY